MDFRGNVDFQSKRLANKYKIGAVVDRKTAHSLSFIAYLNSRGLETRAIYSSRVKDSDTYRDGEWIAPEYTEYIITQDKYKDRTEYHKIENTNIIYGGHSKEPLSIPFIKPAPIVPRF